jgi:O-antigen/teichoic acid export membrane protein
VFFDKGAAVKTANRIVYNTAATYARTLLGIGMGLFSSRWILSALGASDFGLFSLVGSLMVFVTFFNNVMATSSSRHFAFALGKDDAADVSIWFNSSLIIHIVLATVLAMIGWPIGEAVIRTYLAIPAGRMSTSLWVFRISLVTSYIGMLSTPFIGMFTAKQRIAELAFWNILQSFLILVTAWMLLNTSGDRLLLYALFVGGIHCFIFLGKALRASFIFQECQIRLTKETRLGRIKELFFFSFWNMIESSAGLLRNQGSAILLNLYHGPIANAAYGVTKQVSSYTNQFSAAMLSALSPEMTTREGAGNRKSMISLSYRASRIGTMLSCVFAIPLILNMDYILRLWLETPPPNTTELCQLILSAFLVARLTSGQVLAIQAYGKIALYQSVVGSLMIMTLPLIWLMFALGGQPHSIGIAFLALIFVRTGLSAVLVRHLLQEPATIWLRKVATPCILIASLSFGSGYTPIFLLNESFVRLLLSAGASASVTILAYWLIGSDEKEKLALLQMARRVVPFTNRQKQQK